MTERLDDALAIALDDLRSLHEDSLQSAERLLTYFATKICESPIEVLMLGALAFGLHDRNNGARLVPSFTLQDRSNLKVLPQHSIGPYRVDFAIEETNEAAPGLWSTARFVIECDGHNFHERTPLQAARDKARDRFLTTEGWTVMRFTGREIVADARACVTSIEAALTSQHQRQIEAILTALEA